MVTYPKKPAPHNPYDGRTPPPPPEEAPAASRTPFSEHALSAQSRMSDVTSTLSKAIRWGLDSRDPRKVNEEHNPPNWRALLEQMAAVQAAFSEVETYCAEVLTYTGLDRQPIVRDRLEKLVDQIGAARLGYALETHFSLDAVDLLKDQHFNRFVDWADGVLAPPEATSGMSIDGDMVIKGGEVRLNNDRRGFGRIPALIKEHSEDATQRGALVVVMLARLQTLAGKNYECAKAWLVNTAKVETVSALVAKLRSAGIDGRRTLKETLEKALREATDQSEDDDFA